MAQKKTSKTGKSEQDQILDSHEAKGDHLAAERVGVEQADISTEPQGDAPAVEQPGTGMDPDRAAKFVSKLFFKTINRLLPDAGYDDEDQAELAEVLAPVMQKHDAEIFSFMDNWAEEIMLGMVLFDKAVIGFDRMKAARASAPSANEDEPTKTPTTSDLQDNVGGGDTFKDVTPAG